MSPKVVAVVLAGGKSTRMGKNKALLPYRGKRLIDHMVTLAKRAGVRRVLVSGLVEGCRCVPDKVLGKGPVAGLHCVLEAFSKMRWHPKYLLVLPVDMPRLLPGTLKRLLEGIQEAKEDPETDVIHFGGYVLPAVFSGSGKLKETISELLHSDAGDHSVHALLSRLNRKTPPPLAREQKQFINANTPRQWHKLRRQAYA